MGMELNLGARLEQNMSMQLTFAQKMSLEILQMNVQSLEQKIAEELESNPLLEMKTPELDMSLPSASSSLDDRDRGDVSSSESSASEGDASLLEADHIADMQDYFEPSVGEGNYQRPSSDDDELDPLLLLEDQPRDFDAYIEDQLNFHNPDPELRARVSTIVSLLDERGYFVDDLETLVAEDGSQGTMNDWLKALRFVQEELEPAGLGAKDLQECMLIQTYRLGSGFEREVGLLLRQFENLKMNRLNVMATEEGLSVEEVVESVEFFKTLSFRPAAHFFEEKAVAMFPDATVKYDPPDAFHAKGRFRIQLSQRGQPELEVIPGTVYRYEGMSKDERKYLNFHGNNAKALVEAVRRRGETLFLVIQSICQKQQAFFEEGKSALVPLQMQEIAQELEMSAATITRTVKDKSIVTDYGTFELKFFFSMKKVKMGSGEVLERDGTLKALQEVVDAEDKSKPLADSAISKAMLEKGHKVAVRTVAKYRGMLGIPSSSKRKQF